MLATKPDHVQGLVYSGVIRLQQGEEQRGQELLEQAVVLHQDAFLPHFCLGASLAGRGQLKSAVAYLERAVEIDGVPQALYLLGRCRYEMGRLAPAIESLAQAVQVDPLFEECHHLLGLCYLDRGWNRKALTAFRTAQQLNPRRMRYRDLVAYLSGRTGAELPATSPAAADWVSRGEEAIGAGDTAEALRCYRKGARARSGQSDPADDLRPGVPPARPRSGDRSIDSARARFRCRRDAARDGLRNPDRVSAQRGEVPGRETRSDAGCWTKAGRISRRASPTTRWPTTWPRWARTWTRPLDFARRSLEHAPEELRQFPLAALGWVHYKRQELDEAIDFLSQSTELGPSTTVLTRLGMALLASGDEDRARGVLARARRLDDRRGAIEERMMEFMKDSARIIERVRGRA